MNSVWSADPPTLPGFYWIKYNGGIASVIELMDDGNAYGIGCEQRFGLFSGGGMLYGPRIDTPHD